MVRREEGEVMALVVAEGHRLVGREVGAVMVEAGKNTAPRIRCMNQILCPFDSH